MQSSTRPLVRKQQAPKRKAPSRHTDLAGFVLDPIRTNEPSVEARILAAARTIPRGRVVTYGELAELAGIARGHRIAARTMKTAPTSVPWQRVLGKKDARRAEIKIQDREHAARQRSLLTKEGVRFDDDGYVSLREYGWVPPRTLT